MYGMTVHACVKHAKTVALRKQEAVPRNTQQHTTDKATGAQMLLCSGHTMPWEILYKSIDTIGSRSHHK